MMNYTKFPNDVLSMLFSTSFNATQIKIILVIARYTFGFGRKAHGLSIGFLSRATGISRRYISSELKKLTDWGVVQIVKAATHTDARIIKMNRDTSMWKCRRMIPQMKIITPVEVSADTTEEAHFTQEIKKIKYNKEEESEAVINEFEEQTETRLTKYHKDKLTELTKIHGARLMIYALHTALDNGDKPYQYLLKIIKDWTNRGLTTVEAVELYKQPDYKREKHYKKDKPEKKDKYADIYL